MRLAHIVPPRLLTKVLNASDTYHLCLCDLVLNDGDYAQFYRSRSLSGRDFVILDSNAFEKKGEAAAVSDLARAASMISADAVILPDAIGEDGDMTFKRACTARKHWPQLPGHKVDMRFWACPHGVDFTDYRTCAERLAQIPGVTGLCIFEETQEYYGRDRVDVAKDLWNLTGGSKTLHFLGMLEDLSDLQDLWVQHYVMGCDSAKLVRWGLDSQIVRVGSVPTYPGRGDKWYFEHRGDLSVSQLEAIRGNLDYWNDLVRGDNQIPQWSVRQWPSLQVSSEVLIGGSFSTEKTLEAVTEPVTSYHPIVDIPSLDEVTPLEWEAELYRRGDPKGSKVYEPGPYGDVQDLGVRFDLLPQTALRVMAEEMWRGSDRYGLADEEAWKVQSIRRFINHALNHLNDYLAGNRGEDDLAHAACDLMFALHLDIESHRARDVARTFDPAQKRSKPPKGNA